jgi:hypothetical protein
MADAGLIGQVVPLKIVAAEPNSLAAVPAVVALRAV